MCPCEGPLCLSSRKGVRSKVLVTPGLRHLIPVSGYKEQMCRWDTRGKSVPPHVCDQARRLWLGEEVKHLNIQAARAYKLNLLAETAPGGR